MNEGERSYFASWLHPVSLLYDLNEDQTNNLQIQKKSPQQDNEAAFSWFVAAK